MRAGSWRSQESARFEAVGACRAEGPDATLLSDAGRQSRTTHPSSGSLPLRPYPPGSKTPKTGDGGW
eukprot:6181602-Pleurochrysis_carterae.AAC.1